MDRGDYKDSVYYKSIVANFSTEQDQKSFALRLIIHYVGDIHQPLHATSLVNDTYKHGDAGGNYERLPNVNDSGVTTLHAVWDSVGYAYTGYASLPFDSSTWNYYGDEVTKMVPEFPVDPAQLKAGDFDGWAQESLALSESDVYPGFAKNVDITPEY